MEPSSSVLSFTILILPAYSAAISSKIGPTARQGPHHSAQKSTNTGVVLLRTTSSKLAAVTGVVLLIFFSFYFYKFALSYLTWQISDSSGVIRIFQRLTGPVWLG